MIIALLSIGCSAKSPDIPEYEEPKRSYNKQKSCNNVEEARKFNSEEIDAILELDDFRYQLSVAILTAERGDLGLLWETSRKYKDKPSVLFSFINLYFMNYVRKDVAIAHLNGFTDIQHVIDSLKIAAPNNSLPYYLEAYNYLLNENIDMAFNSLSDADKIKTFSIYSKDIMRYSVMTSEYFGCPKYLAMDLGLFTSVKAATSLTFFRLAKLALAEEVSRDMSNSIYNLGDRLHKNGFTSMEEMIALSLKGRALIAQGKDPSEYENEHNRIIEIHKQYADEMSKLSGDDLVEYYEYMLESSELKAIEKYFVTKTN